MALTRALSVVPTTRSQVTAARDQDGGNVDPAADFQRLHQGQALPKRRTAIVRFCHQGVGVADRGWKIHAKTAASLRHRFDQPTATALAPTAYSRIRAQPTVQASNSPTTRISIGVGRACHRNHRGELGVAKRSHAADEAGNDEGQQHARARFLRRLGGEHENAGADHRADTQKCELKGAEGAMQPLFSAVAMMASSDLMRSNSKKFPARQATLPEGSAFI